MQGLMQDWPLLVSSVIEHANANHPEQLIVSRSVEGPIVRETYADLYKRSKRVAKALTKLVPDRADEIGELLDLSQQREAAQ